MDMILGLRLSYLGAALAVLLVSLTPPLRARFLAYGARTSSTALSSAEQEKTSIERDKTKAKKDHNIINQILDQVAQWTVPHDYFWTFYFLSVSLSAFWPGEVLYLKGPLFQAVANMTETRSSSMSFSQLQVTWALMLVQGCRRLYECLTLSDEQFGEEKKAKMASNMWAGHWVLGLWFYATMSVAIWIEGLPTLQSHTLSLADLTFRAPSLRTLFAILLFTLASGFQYDCHTYLADLKAGKTADFDQTNTRSKTSVGTYKIPTHPAFSALICPHYTAECLIYFALAVVAAPQGAWMNWTLTSALVFVVVNLGITAEGTKRWYEQRFGMEKVRGKWRMIPMVY